MAWGDGNVRDTAPASAVRPQAAAAGSFQAGVETSPIPLLSSGTVFAAKDNAGTMAESRF